MSLSQKDLVLFPLTRLVFARHPLPPGEGHTRNPHMTTDFADRFFTDHAMEEEGVWVDFGQGLEVKIRRSDSRRSREVFRRLYKPYRKMEEAGNAIPYDDEILIRAKWTAQALVADWKGVSDRKGKPVKFDPENLKAAIDLGRRARLPEADQRLRRRAGDVPRARRRGRGKKLTRALWFDLVKGKSAGEIEKLLDKAGKPLPDWILNRPRVPAHLAEYWRAFLFLNHARPSSGFGPAAILFSEVRDYLDEYAICGDDRDDCIHFIRALDAEFLGFKPTEGGANNG